MKVQTIQLLQVDEDWQEINAKLADGAKVITVALSNSGEARVLQCVVVLEEEKD